MTKRQHLCLQRRSRPEQSDQRQPNQAANISHQPRASPNSTPLASRIEFPTMTGNWTPNGRDFMMAKLQSSQEEVLVSFDNLARLKCITFVSQHPPINPIVAPLGR